jgi:hypothetical protein
MRFFANGLRNTHLHLVRNSLTTYVSIKGCNLLHKLSTILLYFTQNHVLHTEMEETIMFIS